MANPRSTKLTIMGPITSFRLTTAEVQLVHFAFIVLRYWLNDMSMSHFDREICERVIRVSDGVTRLAADRDAKSHRVHADTFAIAAMMYALRGLGRKHRPRYLGLAWPKATNTAPLLKRLEKFRRRTLRTWFRLGSAKCYREWHARWLRFMKLIQGAHRPIPFKRRNLDREYLERVLKNVRRIVAESHPDQAYREKDLRRIVRAAMRHVRRERACVSIRDLLCLTEGGRKFLDEYIMLRLRRLFWKEFHALPDTRQSTPDEEENEAYAMVLEAARDKARAQALMASWRQDFVASR
jgi:hypothetical protein